MASLPSQRMFQLKLDPLTGASEWIIIEDNNISDTSSKSILCSTSYLDMLNDAQRNSAFREAIDKTVTKPCKVLDIGSGTGLLSMMATRAMGCEDSTVKSSIGGSVTACESYLPMVKLMRNVLRINNMERRINIINKRSDELKVGHDITSRADVLVSEILDSELLGEGIIPTLQHAHDNLLVPNPLTVPYRATTYGQLVESTFLWKLNDLYNNEQNASDGIRLVPTDLEGILDIKQHQYAMHCDAITDIKVLSQPFKIFDFEFWKRPDSSHETELRVIATGDGCVNAIISWWILQLDSNATVFYSTAPKWICSPPFNTEKLSIHGARAWRDHWKQCVWFIRGKGMPVSTHEEVRLQCVHTDTSTSYNIKTQSLGSDVEHFGFSIQDYRLLFSPERIAIYGDTDWRLMLLKAVKIALQGKVSPLCVVADDSLFLTILVAHLSKTSHVISLLPSLCEKAVPYLQAVADANGYSPERVEVLGNKYHVSALQGSNKKPVDLLIGEPFYLGNEAALPWKNLRFWKERTVLDSVLSDNVSIMPCKGILRACAMSLPDVWKSRRPLKDIEGFDHSVANNMLGACGDTCFPVSIWQCGETKELSKRQTIMEFDFSKSISSCSGKTKIELMECGLCHGFVFWMDWVMDAHNSIVFSTGLDSKYWKQGVKLLPKPIPVVGTRTCTLHASFDASEAELAIQCDFVA